MRQVTINSPARIHLGFLDLSFTNIRNFGSLGLTISDFETVIQIKKSKKFEIVGHSSQKALNVFNKLKKFYSFCPCKINILKSIPEHVGLGSGTQLALSLSLVLAKISKINIPFEEFVKVCGRGQRSSVGINCFRKGGFIVDAGKEKKSDNLSPLIFHNSWPEDWKIILLMERNIKGIYGQKEKSEFIKISKEKIQPKNNNFETLVMNIIPSIIEKNFEMFCKGISKIQKTTGEYFVEAQGGLYTSKNVEKIFMKLEKNGYEGYGQTSWGPTGFIFCKNGNEQENMLKLIKKEIILNDMNSITLSLVSGRNKGYYFS